MKKQSRTVPRRRQSVSPTPRHLPLALLHKSSVRLRGTQTRLEG